MNTEREIPAAEVIAMHKEREKYIQKQEKEYWLIFGCHIGAMKRVYAEGNVGACVILRDVMNYSEAQHYLYWKRLFGNMLHSVKVQGLPTELHIVFHLE